MRLTHETITNYLSSRHTRRAVLGGAIVALGGALAYAAGSARNEGQRVVLAQNETLSPPTPAVDIEPSTPRITELVPRASEANNYSRWGIIDEEAPAKPEPISVSGSDILTPPAPQPNAIPVSEPVLSQGDLMVSEGIIKP